jgi:hypothetical protein
MSWGPCYHSERIQRIFGNRKSFEVHELFDIAIPAHDRLWVLLREECVEPNILHEFACIVAEMSLNAWNNPDPRGSLALDSKKKWMAGEIDTVKLVSDCSSVWDYARHYGSNAAWAAAWATEFNPQSCSRNVSQYGFSYPNTRPQDQIEILRKLLDNQKLGMADG